MRGSVPRFPAFEEWESMPEAEQDALLDRMEAAKRRNSWLITGLFCAAVGAGVAAAVYVALVMS